MAERHEIAVRELEWTLDGTGGRRLPRPRRELLLCHIQVAALEAIAADRIVCVGLGAHLFVRDVSHILHLRLLADPDTRLGQLAQEQSISTRKAQKVLEKEQLARSRWTMEAFGVDEYDPALYDIVVGLKQISTERALRLIRDTAAFRAFRTMTYSRKCLEDLVLATKVRQRLLPSLSDLHVRADGDRVIVTVKCSKRRKPQLVGEIKKLAGEMDGVGLVEVHTVSTMGALADAARPEPRRWDDNR